MNPDQNAQPPQKLIDFNQELKALCEKYQYKLRATLQITPDSSAIVATLQAVDAQPKDGVALNTETPEAPKEESAPDAANVAPTTDTPSPDSAALPQSTPDTNSENSAIDNNTAN